MSEPVTAHTGSRREFLGRNGTPEAPAALRPGGRLVVNAVTDVSRVVGRETPRRSASSSSE